VLVAALSLVVAALLDKEIMVAMVLWDLAHMIQVEAEVEPVVLVQLLFLLVVQAEQVALAYNQVSQALPLIMLVVVVVV